MLITHVMLYLLYGVYLLFLYNDVVSIVVHS